MQVTCVQVQESADLSRRMKLLYLALFLIDTPKYAGKWENSVNFAAYWRVVVGRILILP